MVVLTSKLLKNAASSPCTLPFGGTHKLLLFMKEVLSNLGSWSIIIVSYMSTNATIMYAGEKLDCANLQKQQLAFFYFFIYLESLVSYLGQSQIGGILTL